MNRRQFIASSAIAGFAAMAKGACPSGNCQVDGKCLAQLNLCLQWGSIPVKQQDDMNAKLDYLEANGYTAVEIPTGKNCEWLFKNAAAFEKAMQGRKLKCATACGPSDFSYADKAKRDAEVEKFLPALEILGQLKSVGLIICPARGKPELPLQVLRQDFVENTGKRLAEKAAACGTSIVLEPLQRRETPFLRQVADGAAIARDIGKGATVMADFWHMSKEETSFEGAMLAGGSNLTHVHIASLVNRSIPGTDGDADNYVNGFTGLKRIGYRGAVSLEGRWPDMGKDANGKKIHPTLEQRHELLTKMCQLIKKQWKEA
jgi:sugar phosphate isomerase/epimerase